MLNGKVNFAENEGGFLPDDYYNRVSSNKPPLIRDSNGNVKLYRTMSKFKYSQLMEKGEFTAGQGQMENKWLSTNVDNANTWGEKMDLGGIIE